MPTNASVDRALTAISKDESKKLGVSVNGENITTGQYFKRADAQSPPILSFTTADVSQKHIVLALDLDAPFQSWSGLGPILHWIQPGLVASKDNSNTLTATEPFVANYIGPAPPPGSGPHRYTFFLFKQPEGFDGSKFAPPGGKNLGNFKRMWFDLDAWIQKTGLGEVVAVNYFTSN